MRIIRINCVLFLLAVLATAYAGDDSEQRFKSLVQSSKSASLPEQLKTVAKECLDAVDNALAEDDYSAAIKLAALGDECATKAGNVHLQGVCKRRKEDVTQMNREFRKLTKVAEKLASNASDAQSAFEMGKFYCLVAGDWHRGLPLLARSPKAAWREVVAAEQAAPDAIAEQVALGRAWGRLASGEKPPLKQAAQSRAGYWYRAVHRQAIGDTRTQISELMDDLPFRFLTDLDEVEVQPGPWPLGKYGTDGDNAAIAVNGIRYTKGLGLVPPPSGAAWVRYALNSRYKTLSTAVALHDYESGYEGAITFVVLGDGKRLWRSAPFKLRGTAEFCDISVKGVKILELRTECEGTNHGGHAVWLDPVLGR